MFRLLKLIEFSQKAFDIFCEEYKHYIENENIVDDFRSTYFGTTFTNASPTSPRKSDYNQNKLDTLSKIVDSEKGVACNYLRSLNTVQTSLETVLKTDQASLSKPFEEASKRTLEEFQLFYKTNYDKEAAKECWKQLETFKNIVDTKITITTTNKPPAYFDLNEFLYLIQYERDLSSEECSEIHHFPKKDKYNSTVIQYNHLCLKEHEEALKVDTIDKMADVEWYQEQVSILESIQGELERLNANITEEKTTSIKRLNNENKIVVDTIGALNDNQANPKEKLTAKIKASLTKTSKNEFLGGRSNFWKEVRHLNLFASYFIALDRQNPITYNNKTDSEDFETLWLTYDLFIKSIKAITAHMRETQSLQLLNSEKITVNDLFSWYRDQHINEIFATNEEFEAQLEETETNYKEHQSYTGLWRWHAMQNLEALELCCEIRPALYNQLITRVNTLKNTASARLKVAQNEQSIKNVSALLQDNNCSAVKGIYCKKMLSHFLFTGRSKKLFARLQKHANGHPLKEDQINAFIEKFQLLLLKDASLTDVNKLFEEAINDTDNNGGPPGLSEITSFFGFGTSTTENYIQALFHEWNRFIRTEKNQKNILTQLERSVQEEKVALFDETKKTFHYYDVIDKFSSKFKEEIKYNPLFASLHAELYTIDCWHGSELNKLARLNEVFVRTALKTPALMNQLNTFSDAHVTPHLKAHKSDFASTYQQLRHQLDAVKTNRTKTRKALWLEIDRIAEDTTIASESERHQKMLQKVEECHSVITHSFFGTAGCFGNGSRLGKEIGNFLERQRRSV